MQVATKAFPILGVLNGLNKYFGMHYCFPSQVKILELLNNEDPTCGSIASLNRWLRDIQDNGYLIRIRRIKHDRVLGMVFNSTLYIITKKGYRCLLRFGKKAVIVVKKSYPTSWRKTKKGAQPPARVMVGGREISWSEWEAEKRKGPSIKK